MIPLNVFAIFDCVALIVYHEVLKNETTFCLDLDICMILCYANLLGKNRAFKAVVKCPLFFATLYIYLIFLSRLNREKSGKVGKKSANPHKHWVFCAHFAISKPGFCP